MVLLPRRLSAVVFHCCEFYVSWGRCQIVDTALINLKLPFTKNPCERRQCPCPTKCNAHLVGSSATPIYVLRDAVLDTRGGSSYGDADNNNYGYGYGSYRDDRGDDERGYNNDGGQHNRYGYDDRDQGYATSNAMDDNQDGYSGGDYGYSRRKDGVGYYDDEGRYREDYDDRGNGGTYAQRRRSEPKLPTVLTSSNRKLGTILLSAGAVFTALGITLFFNKTLMRLGNLLFVAGVPLTIGPGRCMGYFLQPKKARATACLGCGVTLVFLGWPVIGIVFEIFGLLNLFGNMFPLVMMMAKNLPFVGNLLGGSGGKRKESRYDEDRKDSQYEDRYYEEYREHERY